MADPMAPDLTGLSAEERKIIEEVLARQRAEEQKESQISQAADKELDDIEKQIQNRKETALKLVGTQDDAICQICQKTKFADGIGHKCFYCQLRSCARCGGRTTSKNKVGTDLAQECFCGLYEQASLVFEDHIRKEKENADHTFT